MLEKEKFDLAKDAWSKGKNMTQALNWFYGQQPDHPLIAYDIQASDDKGSYAENFKKNPTTKMKMVLELVDTINSLGEYETLMEVGVGEATTLAPLKSLLHRKSANFGFDISVSRIIRGVEFIKEKYADLKDNIMLFVADLFSIPLAENSIDIVYTVHSIEPNGGRHTEALNELLRVTKKYLILVEPDTKAASDEGLKRMEQHNYVDMHSVNFDAYPEIESVEYKSLKNISANPLYTSVMWIIEKKTSHIKDMPKNFYWTFPGTNEELEILRNGYFGGGHWFPRIELEDYIKIPTFTTPILASYIEKF
jgi:ubiquinone/menaquinone biosynthesis C-methylase UbiE